MCEIWHIRTFIVYKSNGNIWQQIFNSSITLVVFDPLNFLLPVLRYFNIITFSVLHFFIIFYSITQKIPKMFKSTTEMQILKNLKISWNAGKSRHCPKISPKWQKNVPKRSYLFLKRNFEKMIIFKNVQNQQKGNKLTWKFPKWAQNFTLK